MLKSVLRAVLVVLAMVSLGLPASAAQTEVSAASDTAATQKKKQKKPKKAKPAQAAPKAPEKPKESWQLPMKFVIVRGSSPACEPLCPEWIMAEGEITAGSPAAFRKVLKQAGKRKLPVVISSPGGSINAALEIGRMIRKNKLDVAVGTTFYDGCSPFGPACELPKPQKGVYRGKTGSAMAYCNSACPLVLAAGTNRMADEMTAVGVHQTRTDWRRERITYRETYRIVNGKKKVISRKVVSRKPVKGYTTYGLDKRLRKTLTAYLKDMGVSAELLAEMDKAPHSSIYRLPLARQQELGLITRVASSREFSFPSLCPPAKPASTCFERENFLPETPPLQPEAASKVSVSAIDLKAVGINSADPPMTFVRVRDNSAACEPVCAEWIAAQGVITADSPRELGEIIDKMGLRKLRVVFSSPGGDFDAALSMGRMIREKGLDTAILRTGFEHCSPSDPDCKPNGRFSIYKGSVSAGGKCNGACLFAAAGGRRTMGMSPEIILHQPSLYQSRNAGRPAAEQLKLHFGFLGIDRRLAAWMTELKSDQTLKLTPGDRRILLQMLESKDPVIHFDRFKRPPETCYVNTRPTACLPPSAGT